MMKEIDIIYRLAFLILVCVFVLQGCKQEAPILDVNLKGKWTLHKAYRNEKPTRTLDGAYILFEDDKSFKSNLDLDQSVGADPDKLYTFTKSGSKLTLSDIEPQVILGLKAPSFDSISLTTRLGVWELDMHFVRDTVQTQLSEEL